MLKAKFSLPKRNLCASFNMPDCSMSASFEMSNGTKNYEKLENKPSINGVELIGDKTSAELGLATSAQGALAETALQEVPSYYITETELASELSTKQNVITDLSEIREGASLGATSVQPDDIAGMVTSVNGIEPINGNVTITIPLQVNADWNATSGVAEILNKPTIPTDTGDLTNNAGYIKGISGLDVTNALGYVPYDSSNPNGYTSNIGTVTSVNGTQPDSSGNVTITTVASYNDLTNKPSINGVTLSGDKTSANLNLQEKLVSGVNIKKINNISLLGSGNIDIQGGGGGTDKSAVVVSGLNTVPPAFNLDITSEKEFSFDTLKYLHVLTKSKTGNAYSLIDVQFWKDSRNYMRFGCWGSYVVNFKLVINNQTIVSQDLGSTHDMDNYTDILTEMDMVIKKVKVYGAKQGTNATLLYSFDFSQYDYSALDTFYLKSTLCRWGGGNIYNQSIYVNNKTDYTSLMNFHYRYGEYNAIPQIVYPEEFGMATSVKGGDTSGSTVIQTYSPTHKLIDVNMASEAYFAMGTYSSTYTAKTCMMYTKFRVTEITTSCRLTRGAGSAGNYFFDYDTGEFIVKDTLTPELNKWYLLVEDVTNSVGYTSTYGVKAQGQFKLENEGMFVSSVQSQNINAETCRGLYFTGPIPFNTENTKWETPSYVTYETGRIVPIGTLYIPASGSISMYNGTAWKAISS